MPGWGQCLKKDMREASRAENVLFLSLGTTHRCVQCTTSPAVYYDVYTFLYKYQCRSLLKFRLRGIVVVSKPLLYSWHPCTHSLRRNQNISLGTELSQESGPWEWQILNFIRCQLGSSSKWPCQLTFPLAVNEGIPFLTLSPPPCNIKFLNWTKKETLQNLRLTWGKG